MITYLVKGGPVMIAIGFFSILAGAFLIVAWLRIREASQNTSKFIFEVSQSIQKRDWAHAIQVSARYDHPFLKSWRAGLILLLEGKSNLKDVEEAISLEGTVFLSELGSPLKPLSTIVMILPMLGFLGTIVGLIISFQNWERFGAQVSISALAGGIYQAMITTAAGLITAIPYLWFYHRLHARTEKIALKLSQETTQLLKWIKDAILRETPLGSDVTFQTAHDPIT